MQNSDDKRLAADILIAALQSKAINPSTTDTEKAAKQLSAAFKTILQAVQGQTPQP